MRSPLPAVVLILALAVGTPVVAQDSLVGAAATPPQRAVSVVIAPPGTLCSELTTQFPGAGGARGDLRDRCNELILAASNPGLLGDLRLTLSQWAPDEIPTVLGTNNAAFTSIGARLGALRAGVTGVVVQGVALSPALAEPPALRLASLAPVTVASTAPVAAPDPFGKLGIFVNATYSMGSRDATDRVVGFDFDTLGVTAGADYRFARSLVLGAAFAYASSRGEYPGSGGALDSDDYSGSIYGTYYPTERLFVDWVAGYGMTHYRVVRNIRYGLPALTGGTTAVDQSARASTDGAWYALGVATGYEANLGAFTFGPLVRVNYSRTRIDGYRETLDETRPGFGLGLDIGSQTVESLVSGLGVQASYAVSTPLGVLTPQVRLEWRHEFKDDRRSLAARFVNDPSPDAATTITWETDDPDRNFFDLSVGLSATLRHGVSTFVYYETTFAQQDHTAHRVAAGLRVAF